MRIYLGTHLPNWLADSHVPLFICRRRLIDRRSFPRAREPWVLDSGGYMELGKRGSWSITATQYAREIELYRREIGRLEWAAPMDWMCEESILAQTGLSVAEHQRRTTESFLVLRDLAGGIVAPVLQGWTLDDYLRHADAYAEAGVDLEAARIVGVGSVCRRHADRDIHTIIRGIAPLGLRLHAFGVRARSLASIADVLASSDSMAWSTRGRNVGLHSEPIDHPHPRGAKSCANCRIFAERWHRRTLDTLERSLLYTGAAA